MRVVRSTHVKDFGGRPLDFDRQDDTDADRLLMPAKNGAAIHVV
jgi:hypothetical protein